MRSLYLHPSLVTFSVCNFVIWHVAVPNLIQALGPADGDPVAVRRGDEAERRLLGRGAMPLAVVVHLPAELAAPPRVLARHVVHVAGGARLDAARAGLHRGGEAGVVPGGGGGGGEGRGAAGEEGGEAARGEEEEEEEEEEGGEQEVPEPHCGGTLVGMEEAAAAEISGSGKREVRGEWRCRFAVERRRVGREDLD